MLRFIAEAGSRRRRRLWAISAWRGTEHVESLFRDASRALPTGDYDDVLVTLA
jgi:hypothetical protein